jgi:2,3-dihydroxyphenylpropionate 1,2-dioxygenase
MAAGMALASGQSAMKPLNPAWDQRWMDALAGGSSALDALCAMSEDAIAQEGGRSAHESKSWLVARSALPGLLAPQCIQRHYQAIPEYIAGFGLLWLEPNL